MSCFLGASTQNVTLLYWILLVSWTFKKNISWQDFFKQRNNLVIDPVTYSQFGLNMGLINKVDMVCLSPGFTWQIHKLKVARFFDFPLLRRSSVAALNRWEQLKASGTRVDVSSLIVWSSLLRKSSFLWCLVGNWVADAVDLCFDLTASATTRYLKALCLRSR